MRPLGWAAVAARGFGGTKPIPRKCPDLLIAPTWLTATPWRPPLLLAGSRPTGLVRAIAGGTKPTDQIGGRRVRPRRAPAAPDHCIASLQRVFSAPGQRIDDQGRPEGTIERLQVRPPPPRSMSSPSGRPPIYGSWIAHSRRRRESAFVVRPSAIPRRPKQPGIASRQFVARSASFLWSTSAYRASRRRSSPGGRRMATERKAGRSPAAWFEAHRQPRGLPLAASSSRGVNRLVVQASISPNSAFQA